MLGFTASRGGGISRVLTAVLAVVFSAIGGSTAVAAPVSGPQPEDAHVAREAARKQQARQNGATAAEWQRRAASRRAFRGLTAGEALQLARGRHPEIVLTPAWRAPALPDGHSIAGYESDFVARLAGPGGNAGNLVVSSVPMRAVDRRGVKAPVDLSLDRLADAFRPVNPLAESRLSERLADGLAAPGSGLTIRPVGAGGHAAPLLSGDALFYGEAFRDSDVIVRPTVDGFSLNLQIRSEDSPERFALDLDVADGYTLEAAPESSMIEIWRGGKLQGVVTAPIAWDADRRPIALTWRLEGSRLTIDVPHRGQDLAYPLLVDPDVVETYEWERYGVDGQYGSINGWNYEWSGNFQNLSWAGNSTWLGNGLYIRNLQWGMGTSALYFYAGNSGTWRFSAPGLARLNRVEWNLFDQDYVDGTCTELGIGGPAGWRPGNPSWNHCGIYYNQYAQSWGSGEPGDSAAFKVQAVTTGHKPYFAAQVGVVYLYLGDPDVPSVASGLTESWVNSPPSTKLDVWAVDSGLGISELRLTAPNWTGTTIGPETYTRCSRTYLCPRSVATDTWPEGSPRNATIGNMPEGLNEIAVTARDAAGNQRTSAETAPVTGQGLRAAYYNNPDLTGLVHGRVDAGINFDWGLGSPHASVGADTFSVRWSGYVEAPETGTYTFQTSTDDGVRLWVGNMDAPIIDDWRPHGETARNGTVSLTAGRKYRIVMEYYEETSGAIARLRWRTPSRPSTEAPVTIPATRLSPPGGWRLKLDRGSPAFDEPSGELWNKRGQAVDGDSSVRVTARDGNPAGPNAARRSGVRRMEVYLSYPGDPVPGLLVGSKDQPADCPVDPAQPTGPRSTDSCPLTYDYTFRASDPTYPDGRYTVTFKAFDHASNPASEKSWSFIKDSLPPQILDVTHNPALTESWIRSRQMSVKVKAADIGTGIKGMTLTKPTPTGPDEDTQENACLGTVASICPNPDEKTFPYHTDELREGYVEPFVRAFDATRRHSTPATWRLKVDRSGPSLATPSGALWDRRNQAADHRQEGLYDRFHSAQLTATDGSNTNSSTRRSGTKAINVKVRKPTGEVVIDSPDPQPQGCPEDSCSKSRTFTLDGDSVPDGVYTIEVIAVDQLDNASAPTRWDVTVDRRGDVYQAQNLTGNPTAGGELMAEESARINTRTARRQLPDMIATRTDVACDDSNPGGAQCPEARFRTLESQFEGATADDLDSFTRHRGAYANDPNVRQIADVLEPAEFAAAGEAPAATGSLMSMLQPWQTPPPARGTTFERYDFEFDEAMNDGPYDETTGEHQGTTTDHRSVVQIWVDAATKMPVRQTVTAGTTATTTYWSYRLERKLTSELPADFFLVPPPQQSGLDQETNYRGNASVGTTQDRQTGAAFTPRYLGPTVTVGQAPLCLGGSVVFRHRESTPRDAPASDPYATTRNVSDITRVTSMYVPLTASGVCTPGRGTRADTELEVMSFAKDSGIAQAYKDAIVPTATAIQTSPTHGDFLRAGPVTFTFGVVPTVAYVIPGASGSVAVADVGDSTVLIRGPFTKDEAGNLFSNLEAR